MKNTPACNTFVKLNLAELLTYTQNKIDYLYALCIYMGFPRCLSGKESTANAGDAGEVH